jgi:signal peptidase I
MDFYKVSGNSMFPSLYKGDMILISRVNYFFGMPAEFFNEMQIFYKDIKKNDALVFKNYASFHNDKFLIKRVAAKSGDSIRVNITRDGLEYSHLDIYNDYNFKIPGKNSTVELNLNNLKLYERLLIEENNKIEIKDNSIYLNGIETENYTFKYDYFFVLGDNYTNSLDSRHYGLVSKMSVIGKPIIVISSNIDGQDLRWIY